MYPRLAHFGHVVVPTYSVVAALGLVLALLLAEWCAPRAGLSRERVWNLGLLTLIVTVMLSRMVLILQSPAAFRSYPRLLLTLPTLTRWGPLLVLASAVACIALLRLPWLPTLDAATPAFLLLITMLHGGSFFAGDDLGSHTSLALGNLVRGDEGHHPVALYAALMTALACAASLLVLTRPHRAGAVFGTGLAAAAVARYLADEFRPLYTLPSPGIPGFLRFDQIALLLLALAGTATALRGRRNHAE